MMYRASKVRFLDKRVQPPTVAVAMGLMFGAFYLIAYWMR
ncbi:MAG: hypothetical protein JWQ51_2556 [Tardiphaga sp.]|nr:hypothetical protein [Tardiphaga sp.]